MAGKRKETHVALKIKTVKPSESCSQIFREESVAEETELTLPILCLFAARCRNQTHGRRMVAAFISPGKEGKAKGERGERLIQ